jgi:hypothetical protein
LVSLEEKKSMKCSRNVALFLTVLVGAFVYCGSAVAQEKIPLPGPGMEMGEVPRPTITGSDPKPQDAAKAILAAFDKYEVVGMGAAHGNKDLDDFILKLVRDPGLPGRINDIAVECGNSLYQPILDRYIAGDEVGLEDVRPVWRNTTQPMCGISAFYEELFPLVRRINQRLPPRKKFRMLACDPPIDWGKVKTRDDATHDPAEPATVLQAMERDPAIASVMEREVFSKHHKALMLFGTGHLYHTHGGPMLHASAVEMYEKNHPGVTLRRWSKCCPARGWQICWKRLTRSACS